MACINWLRLRLKAPVYKVQVGGPRRQELAPLQDASSCSFDLQTAPGLCQTVVAAYSNAAMELVCVPYHLISPSGHRASAGSTRSFLFALLERLFPILQAGPEPLERGIIFTQRRVRLRRCHSAASADGSSDANFSRGRI